MKDRLPRKLAAIMYADVVSFYMDSRLFATRIHEWATMIAAVIYPAFSSELCTPGPNGFSAAEALITVSASMCREAYQDPFSPVRPG